MGSSSCPVVASSVDAAEDDRDEAAEAIDAAEDSLLLNPRAARYRGELGALRDTLDMLNRVGTQVRGMTRAYVDHYDASLLFPLSRTPQRLGLGLHALGGPEVGGDGLDLTVRGELVDRGRQFGLLARGQVDLGSTGLQQSAGDHHADTAPAAGHQRGGQRLHRLQQPLLGHQAR